MTDTKVAPSKNETQEILKRARDRYEYSEERDGKNRKQAREDTEFVYVPGKQWDSTMRTKRESWGDPCLEFPQLKQFVNQVVNDQRQNRPGIRIHAASADASKEVADIIQGMIRGIEYDSQAEAVYDSGYHGAVTGGRGYWRITADYESPQSFNQVIKLQRVADPDSVRLDPDYRDPDGGDRNWGYVLEKVPNEEFAERWPDAEPLDVQQRTGSWYPDDKHVLVADYYERHCTYRTLVALANGTIGFLDDLTKVYSQAGKVDLEPQIVKRRKSEEYTVNWYTIAGGDQILETHAWPGTMIPVICAMGDEVMVDGSRIYQGVITQAKSSQSMFNYGMTNQAIHLALTPRAPWVAAVGQIKGLESIWNEANNRNWSVLPYNPVDIEGTALPPPQRQPPASPDAGWLNWTQQMQGLMRSTIGMYENSLGLHGQETSGRAILAREKQGDNSTYHYADNLARAIALTGRIIVECIPYFYDAERIVHIIGEDGKRTPQKINEEAPPMPNAGPAPMQGMPPPGMAPPGMPPPGMAPGMPPPPDPQQMAVQAIVKNDVRVGQYAVTVAAGPGYETKRSEMAELLMQLVQADPMVLQAAGDIIVGVQDIPEADLIAERIRVLLPPPVQAIIAAKDAKQDPKIAAMQQQMQQMQQQGQQQMQQLQQQLQAAAQENAQLKADKSASIAASNARAQAAQATMQRDQQSGMVDQENANRKFQYDAASEQRKADADREKMNLEREKVMVDLFKALIPLWAPQPQTIGQEAAIVGDAVETADEPDGDDAGGIQ